MTATVLRIQYRSSGRLAPTDVNFPCPIYVRLFYVIYYPFKINHTRSRHGGLTLQRLV